MTDQAKEQLSEQGDSRLREMVALLDELAARARGHVDVMRAAVQESVRWSSPADVHWARGALDDAIVSAAEAERDLKEARAVVGEIFGCCS